MISCNSSVSKDLFDIVIKADLKGMDSIPAFRVMVDSIEYIPLESGSETMLSSIEHFVVFKNKFFISDGSSVKCFSDQGHFLFNIGHIGRGPGEYVEVLSISCDSCFFYVFDQTCLYQYDALTGNYIKSFYMDHPYAEAYVKDGLVYLYDRAQEYTIAVKKLSEESSKERIIYTSPMDMVYAQKNMIISSGEKLFFSDPLKGYVYSFENGEMNKFLHFDVGRENLVPETSVNGNNLNLFKDKFMQFENVIIAGNFIHFKYCYNNIKYQCFVNYISGKCCSYNIDRAFKEQIRDFPIEYPLFPYYSDGTYLYQEMSPSPYVVKHSYTINPPSKYPSYSLLRESQDDDNPIILRIKLKDDFLK